MEDRKFFPHSDPPKGLMERMEKTRIGEIIGAGIERARATDAKRAPPEMRAVMVIALYAELRMLLGFLPKKLSENTLEHLVTTLMHADPEVMRDQDAQGKTVLDKMKLIYEKDMKDWHDNGHR